jgi:16S rRNA (guanine1516-N2)-methyltransferase
MTWQFFYATIHTMKYSLIQTEQGLALQKPDDHKFKPFLIDFLSGPLAYRIKQAGLKKEMIARAMGCHPRENPVIVDATAGLGRDSFILASLGYSVIMLERSPILHALLKDGLERASQNPSLSPIIKRLHLFHADAIAWLSKPAYTRRPDIIYLDPMFPERKKSASVRKEMVILQELLGKDMDCDKLFEAALENAIKRVVVKRPKLAENVGERAPNFSLSGKANRFDIYLT